jgi:ribose transport system substrate-binding protein
MNSLFKSLCCGLLALAFGGSVLAQAPLRIAVVPKGTTHEFWRSIHAGARAAQEALAAEGVRVEVIWQGPLREDDREQQIQVVENFIGRRVAGIVLAPLDTQALVAPVEQAVRARIPVLVIDSGLNSERIVSFVATDNREGGRLGARRLGELLGGEGNVILLRYQTGSASTEAREAGFLETMAQEYPRIRVLSSDQHGGATRDTAFRAAQNLLNRHGRDVHGIFAPNESTTVGTLLALREAGLAGDRVKLVGFDTARQSLEAIRQGDLHGLVVQNPFRMGYLGVRTMVSHLQGRPVERLIDTGVAVVTAENIDDPELADLLNPPLERYLR